MRLTAEGERVLRRCTPLVRKLQDTGNDIRSGRLGPNGIFRISAPISFGRRHIAALVATYRQRYPAVATQLVLSDKGGHVMRRLPLARRAVCAAPSYLAAYGAPIHPNDLAGREAIALLRDGRWTAGWSRPTASCRPSRLPS